MGPLPSTHIVEGAIPNQSVSYLHNRLELATHLWQSFAHLHERNIPTEALIPSVAKQGLQGSSHFGILCLNDFEKQQAGNSDGSTPIGLHTIGGGRMNGRSHPSQDRKKKKQGVWTSIMSVSRTESESEQRQANDAESDEINLTGEAERDAGQGVGVKNSWALGQSLTESTAEGQRSGTDDDRDEHMDSGIVAKKTYSITRS